MSVPHARGFMQQVEVFVRDRATGQVSTRYYSTPAGDLITRQRAIDQALDEYDAAAEDYDEEVLGAVHTGAFSLGAEPP